MRGRGRVGYECGARVGRCGWWGRGGAGLRVQGGDGCVGAAVGGVWEGLCVDVEEGGAVGGGVPGYGHGD